MSYLMLNGEGDPVEVPAPVDTTARFDAIDKELARLNATAEKDLFFRKIATAAAVVGLIFGAMKIVDLLTYIERRRAARSETP